VVHLAERREAVCPAIAGGLRERGFSTPVIHTPDLDKRDS